MRVHCRIRVEVHDAQLWRGTLDSFQMRRRVHPPQMLKARQRGIVIGKIRIQTLRNHVITDRGQALRAFRMIRAHVV